MPKKIQPELLIFLIIIIVSIGSLGIYTYSKTTSANSNKALSVLEDSDRENGNSSASPETIMNSNTNSTSQYSELIKEDTVIGTGAEATAGKQIKVNYTGKFLDGSIFDSSLKPGRTPLEITLGAGQVIQGWDQGIVGMKVGGKRTLKIPYALAYGEAGYASIPPKADLIFEVELLEVR